MFSKTCEYAIRATIIIASETASGQRISLREIARKIQSPESFTAKILQKLAKDQIVLSNKGNGGGFFVTKEMLSKVFLSDIVLCIDGATVFNKCSLGLNDCSDDKPCPFHHQFKPIREQLKQALTHTSLEQLVDGVVEKQTFLRI